MKGPRWGKSLPRAPQAELHFWARLSNRLPSSLFDHGGELRKFRGAQLQSSSRAPSVKRLGVVRRRALGDFCMVICYGGGGGRVARLSKELFEVPPVVYMDAWRD